MWTNPLNLCSNLQWEAPFGPLTQTPKLIDDTSQYYEQSLIVYSVSSIHPKTKTPDPNIHIDILYRHTHTHILIYLPYGIYMRYSLCLVFYCIQHGKQNCPPSSEVQAQEWRTGALKCTQLPPFSHQQRGRSRRDKEVKERKVFGLSTSKKQTEGKQSSDMINDHIVIA